MKLSDVLFFSGTFNPIHNGHIEIARDIKKKMNCKKIVFVPTYAPYHKIEDANVSFNDKIDMVKLAISEYDDCEVSDIDKRANSENSYSINTVNLFLKEFFEENEFEPNSKLNFLLGADAFSNLDKWYKVNELAEKVNFIVAARPSEENPGVIAYKIKQDVPHLMYYTFVENYDISSSKIRQIIRENKSADQYLNKHVMQFIKDNGLYA